MGRSRVVEYFLLSTHSRKVEGEKSMVDISAYSSLALNAGVMIGSIIIFAGVAVGLWFAWRIHKRYSQYLCVVFEKDGAGQLVRSSDRAGIFVDSKTKNKRFFLKKANVGLEPDNVPYITSHGGGMFTPSKTVFLLRTGLKNFQFISFDVLVSKEQKSFDLHVGEEDVNWAINSYERAKTMFASSMLMQLLPWIALAFVGVVMMVIFVYFFQKLDVIKEMAVALKEAATQIAQARSGTLVVTPP